MTSVVMIFELTRDYAVIVPLMISNLVSYFIASRLQRTPIYEVLAQQDGIHLPVTARAANAVKRVSAVMRPATEVLDAKMLPGEALESVRGSGLSCWPITEERGVMGVASLKQLEELASTGTRSSTRPLGELLGTEPFPHLHADHSLDAALHRMGAARLNVLPVVSRANVHQLEGVVTLGDVLALYGVREPAMDHSR